MQARFVLPLFVSDLAFASESLTNEAKAGILAASLLAGIVGHIVLMAALPRKGAAAG